MKQYRPSSARPAVARLDPRACDVVVLRRGGGRRSARARGQSALAMRVIALVAVGLLGACDSDAPSGHDAPDEGAFDVAVPDAGDAGRDAPDAPDDTDVAQDAQACGCEPGEVCIDEACYTRDCAEEECDSGQVCFEDRCVSRDCAGVECGAYPNICRDGVCTTGSCETDPDVRCPGGLECVDDQCLLACTVQADCGDLACIGGFCRICDVAADCGDTLICLESRCVPPCTEDPELCDEDEVCDPDTGRCDPACDDESPCPPGEVCRRGVCEDEQCTPDTEDADCRDDELCLDGECVQPGPESFGGLSAGAAILSSTSHTLHAIVGPVAPAGTTLRTPTHTLVPGTLGIGN